VVISRSAKTGSIKAYLKFDEKDNTVTYIFKEGQKEKAAILMQNGALTFSGLALQEMAQTRKTDRDIKSLIQSGLVSQQWPEREGEGYREMHSRHAPRRRKGEKMWLSVTNEGREVLNLISQK
jgi:hypothetical protein